MPSLVIGGNLPVQTRKIIGILLIIICAAIVGAILACFVGKAINLYREHKHNQELAKRALDIEACMLKEDKRIFMSRAAHPDDFFLVPSFPPVAYTAPWWGRRSAVINQATVGHAEDHRAMHGNARHHIENVPASGYCYAMPTEPLSGRPQSAPINAIYPCFSISHPAAEASFTARGIRHHHQQFVFNDGPAGFRPSNLPLRGGHSDSGFVVPSGKLRLATAVEGGTATGDVIQECGPSMPGSASGERERAHVEPLETSKGREAVEAETSDSSLAYYHQN